MKKFVVDSSVLIKSLVDEAYRDQANRLLKSFSRGEVQLLVPYIAKFEVLDACIVNHIEITKPQIFLSHLENLGCKFVLLDDPLIEKAEKICKEGNKKSGYPRFYDATYHALALQNDAIFITADSKYIAKAEHLGQIMHIGEWSEKAIHDA